MTSPTNQPPSPGRSRKRRFALLAAGLGLVVLVAAILVVQLVRDEAPNPEADFSDGTCEDFDLAGFEAFSEGGAEFSEADGGKFSDPEGYTLICDYTSDSGMTLRIGLSAVTSDEPASSSVELEDTREFWEKAPGNTVEDFDNGDLVGYTLSYERDSEQNFGLAAAAGHLAIGVQLAAESGAFEPADALGFIEEMAGQALKRFEAYV